MLIPLGILDFPVAAGSYDLLQTEILTGSQATVTFSGLVSAYSADYQHLQVRMSARSTRTSNINTVIFWTINGSGSTYAYHTMYGDGSSVVSEASTSTSSMLLNYIPSATATTNAFGADIIDILDPFETSKNPTFRAFGGHTQSRIQMSSGFRTNTEAIDSLEISAASFDFVTGSRFSIYGLKKASA